LNGADAAAAGKWTHSTSGKASIFTTSHIGNPPPTHDTDFYSAAALADFTACWNMNNAVIDNTDGSTKALFTGLF